MAWSSLGGRDGSTDLAVYQLAGTNNSVWNTTLAECLLTFQLGMGSGLLGGVRIEDACVFKIHESCAMKQPRDHLYM